MTDDTRPEPHHYLRKEELEQEYNRDRRHFNEVVETPIEEYARERRYYGWEAQ